MAAAPVIILTGASRGIGLAILEILLKANTTVLALSRTETPQLTALASKYPGVLVIVKGDISNEEDNKSVVELAIQSFGKIDGLILNAGTLSPLGPVSTLGSKLSEVKDLFTINFFSLISLIGFALPYLKQNEGDVKGRIVMVSSGAAEGGIGGWGAYSASKAAMNSLARTLGNEESEIVTVAIRPGVVSTDMQVAIRAQGGDHMKPTEHARFLDLHSSGSLLPPSKPGSILAGLALTAEKELSGKFISWDDETLKSYTLPV